MPASPGSSHGAEGYRGRLAPSPTGYLHLGHARTFWIAMRRARLHGGALVLRSEDLDAARCRREYAAAMIEDLRWLGLEWREGPDTGGPLGPYEQSRRMDFYREAFIRLRAAGRLYPCTCSRKDIQNAIHAPQGADEEPLYPGTCRDRPAQGPDPGTRANWRFRVPEKRSVTFIDGNFGSREFITGRDFGDFVVWRQDGVPAYQLAVVVDDAAMRITDVVRGADLLLSTARQILLYEALGWNPPAFYHCELVNDESGARLAKRHDALSLRTLRGQGMSPERIRERWGFV